MRPDSLNDSSKTALSLQYFIYFGVLGIYLPYFNLYCFHLGLSGVEIGRIAAMRNITIAFFPLLWSLWADYRQIRRSLFITCCFINMAIWSGFFWADAFLPILVLSIVHGIFYAPIISFLEAFTMDVLGKSRNSYGRVRVWGSISFIIMVLVVGYLVDNFALKLIIILIFAGSFGQALLSLKMPVIVINRQQSLIYGLKSLIHPPMVIFLVSAFLMLVSHGAYYGFFSIHLESLHFSKFFIGFAWALASIAEIVVMVFSDKLLHRFRVQHILILAFTVAILRWLLLSFARSAPIILAAQLLHAITYGAFHISSILYIDQMIPAESKTIGQAMNNAVTYGLGLMVGFELSGHIYQQMGATPLFLFSSGTALMAGLIFIGYSVYSLKGGSASRTN